MMRAERNWTIRKREMNVGGKLTALVVQHLGLDMSLAFIVKPASQLKSFDNMLKNSPTIELQSKIRIYVNLSRIGFRLFK